MCSTLAVGAEPCMHMHLIWLSRSVSKMLGKMMNSTNRNSYFLHEQCCYTTVPFISLSLMYFVAFDFYLTINTNVTVVFVKISF